MQVLLTIDPFFVPSLESERQEYANSQGGKTYNSLEGFIQDWAGRKIDEVFDKHKSRPEPVVIDGVPQEISKRQAYQELIQRGLHDNEDTTNSAVMKCIKLIPDKIVRQQMLAWFCESQNFQRWQPILIQVWTAPAPQGLGLPIEELDEAFISASKR